MPSTKMCWKLSPHFLPRLYPHKTTPVGQVTNLAVTYDLMHVTTCSLSQHFESSSFKTFPDCDLFWPPCCSHPGLTTMICHLDHAQGPPTDFPVSAQTVNSQCNSHWGGGGGGVLSKYKPDSISRFTFKMKRVKKKGGGRLYSITK